MDLLLNATFKAEHRHFWFRSFRRVVRPLLAQGCRGVARPVLLDCGCGTGANLELLSTFGRVFGCDLTWSGLTRAREAGRRTIVQASVARLPYPDETFDLVAVFDVLYSLPDADERAAVHEMSRVLRPGGALLVHEPALAVLRGDHSILSREVRRYTTQQLSARLRQSGLAIERLTYTNASLVPILLPLRTYHRLRGLAPEEGASAEIRVPPAPLNALLSATLALEAALLKFVDMPFGSSTLALARKPGAKR